MTAMRMAGKEEGKGGKVMVMATRVAGEQTVILMKSTMAIKMREVCKEEGIGSGSKSNDNGEENNDGKQ
jgi:hypothetical protein